MSLKKKSNSQALKYNLNTDFKYCVGFLVSFYIDGKSYQGEIVEVLNEKYKIEYFKKSPKDKHYITLKDFNPYLGELEDLFKNKTNIKNFEDSLSNAKNDIEEYKVLYSNYKLNIYMSYQMAEYCYLYNKEFFEYCFNNKLNLVVKYMNSNIAVIIDEVMSSNGRIKSKYILSESEKKKLKENYFK